MAKVYKMAKAKMKKVKDKDLTSNEFNLTTRDGKSIEVPHEGSMGILGLGHVGLFAWRAKRKELGVFPFDKDTQKKLKKAGEKRLKKQQEKANK